MYEQFAEMYKKLVLAAHKKMLENTYYGMCVPDEPCILASGDVTSKCRFGNMTFNPLVYRRTICPDKDAVEMVWERFSAPNGRKYNPSKYYLIRNEIIMINE
jgi:hypothetical protein